jgi:general secretion pathway protein C
MPQVWGGLMVSLKRYLWLFHLALITAAVYIGSDLFWAIVGSRIEPANRLPTSSPSAAAETTEKRTLQQYAVIQERNLFGARGRAAAPPPARPSSAPAAAAKPAANLKLVGTVVGTPERTYAVIEDLGTKRQELYRLGDLVRDAKVVEVTRNRVVLDNRGRREELFSFEKSDSAGTPPSESMPRQSAAPRRSPPPGASQPRELPPEPQPEQEPEVAEAEIEQVSENMWRINRDDLVEQLDNFGQMMKEARLTPHFTGGQPDGFMITNLPRNSFLGRMGLRNGDIMKGVNGQKFGSLEEFFQAYQQLQTEPILQLEIERSNRSEMLSYEIR